MYNDCFGGFGISGFAKIEYAKRILTKPFKVYSSEYSDKELAEEEISELSECPNLHSIHIIKNDGKEFKFPNWWSDQSSRRDPILLSLLEEYGSEKISSSCSRIAIEEIDETDYWKIIEFEDGAEEVITLSTNGWHK
jgi:hypothetical protein